MNTRFARRQDYPEIGIINRQLHAMHTQTRPDLFNDRYQSGLSQGWYNMLLSSEAHRIIVIEDFNKVVGYALLEIKTVPHNTLMRERRYLLVDQIAVLSTHQNRGLGGSLLEAAEALACREGLASMELNVLQANRRAMAFYESAGMQIQSCRFEKTITCEEVK